MLEAALWAFLAAASLLIGVELAFLLRPSRRTIGLVMAFGAGAMISAVVYELVLDASKEGPAHGVARSGRGGALTFFAGDRLLDRGGGGGRKPSTGEQARGSPLAVVLGAALDGVPESLIIGLSLVLGSGVAVSFVAATFLSNLPESMSATTGLHSFAAGALLTMLADTMVPEAFEFGGKLVGLLTVAGFLTALGLSGVT